MNQVDEWFQMQELLLLRWSSRSLGIRATVMCLQVFFFFFFCVIVVTTMSSSKITIIYAC